MSSGTMGEPHLYGEVGAESLDYDLATTYEKHEPGAELPRPDVMIEEWTTRPPRSSLNDDQILEWIVENICENDLGDEFYCEAWENAALAEEVKAAFAAALDLLASKITYRMADELVTVHIITHDEAGEPMLDGKPLYQPARANPEATIDDLRARFDLHDRLVTNIAAGLPAIVEADEIHAAADDGVQSDPSLLIFDLLPCPTCEGQGHATAWEAGITEDVPCLTCDGTGYEPHVALPVRVVQRTIAWIDSLDLEDDEDGYGPERDLIIRGLDHAVGSPEARALAEERP